jgi:hypothetical protein
VKTTDYSPSFPSKVQQASVGDFVLPFDLSYELDLWGRVRRMAAAAREAAQASSADYATAKLSLEAELAMDYFEFAQRGCSETAPRRYRESLHGQFAAHHESVRRRSCPEGGCCPGETQLDTRAFRTPMSLCNERSLNTPSPS